MVMKWQTNGNDDDFTLHMGVESKSGYYHKLPFMGFAWQILPFDDSLGQGDRTAKFDTF